MTRIRKIWAAASVALLGTAAGWFVFAASREAKADYTDSQSIPSAKAAWKDFFYQDASKCTQCHSLPGPANNKSWDLCGFSEYPIWKTHDKHAQAYAVLQADRGRKIGELLFPKLDKEQAHAKITENATGCLGCHAMSTLPGEMGKGVDKEDGVSCGGCHGPSGGTGSWLGPHADKDWRTKSPEFKYKMGLRNLRDPVIKAELCMSCHIGNAEEGKVVTHAMMAAGHPPLPPIDIVTFSRNEPQHWRDPKYVEFLKGANPDVLANFSIRSLDFHQTETAVIGGIVAIRETLKLVKERSNVASESKSVFPELAIPAEGIPNTAKDRWPEIAMAHSDCFACHHDLRFPGFRQDRGFIYHVPRSDFTERVIPGRPMVRLWPTGGLTVGALQADAAKLSSIKPLLSKLTKATNARPFGDSTELTSSADGLIAWCNELIVAVKKTPLDRAAAIKLAREIASLYTEKSAYKPDAETARQIGSIFAVVLLDLGVKPEAIADLRKELHLEPYFNLDKRADLIMGIANTALGNDPKLIESSKKFTEVARNLNRYENKALLGNDFLVRLFATFGNKEFMEGFIKNKNDLQKLSDAEQEKVLAAVAGYTPKKFFDAAEKAAKLIPER